MNNTTDILNEFHTIIGDGTDLSSDEEIRLLNKIYNEVLRKKLWEFLKKEATGSINGTEITQPSDFASLFDNGDGMYIYLGENDNKFKIVPFAERRIYKNTNNIAYYDARQEKIIFTKEQNDTYSFDYIYQPIALTTVGSNPVFPSRFWSCLSFLMASDNDIIQLSEKARSYLQENRARGEMIIADMEMWNDRISSYLTYGN